MLTLKPELRPAPPAHTPRRLPSPDRTKVVRRVADQLREVLTQPGVRPRTLESTKQFLTADPAPSRRLGQPPSIREQRIHLVVGHVLYQVDQFVAARGHEPKSAETLGAEHPGQHWGMGTVSASQARQRLFSLIEQINTDHEPVRITSKAGNAVLMSADDYDSWQETVYLLRSPENARRLMEAVARDKSAGGR